MRRVGAAKGPTLPRPENELEPLEHAQRSPSHFRKKRSDETTKLIRLRPAPERLTEEPERSYVGKLRANRTSVEANPPPSMPTLELHRPLPPPAPLPVEGTGPEPPRLSPTWTEQQARRKRVEEVVGVVTLAVLVLTMLTVLWMRMAP